MGLHGPGAMQQMSTSPRLDSVGSPYLQDRPTPTSSGLPQGGPSPSPYSTYLGLGTPEYVPGASSPAFSGAPGPAGQLPPPGSISRPASAAGTAAFREQQQGGSMPPPPGQPGRRAQQPGSNAPTPQAAQAPTPQPTGQTPSATQYESPGVTPQTPSAAAAAVPAAKRKRDSTKDTRETKKVRLVLQTYPLILLWNSHSSLQRSTKGRDRSNSTTSNVQAPTPSPVAAPASVPAEYMQSPSGMLDGPSPHPTLAEPEIPVSDSTNDAPGLQSEPALMMPSTSTGQYQPEEVRTISLPNSRAAADPQMQLMFSSSQNGYEPPQAAPDSSYDYALQGSEGTYNDPLGFQQALGFPQEDFSFDDYMYVALSHFA